MEPRRTPDSDPGNAGQFSHRPPVIEDACGCVRHSLNGSYIAVCRAHAPLKHQPAYAALMADAEEVPYRG